MPDIQFPFELIVKGKGTETFPDDHSYIGRGGEGTILRKDNTAYKIYHDVSRMIPIEKIEELQALRSLSNVLGPQDILLDAKQAAKPIGFSMCFKTGTEYLSRLFNKTFKEDNSITPDKIVELINQIQKTIQQIHKKNILIVDLNEMNFLVDKKNFTNPFFIDVDSYQTPKHHATAIMQSIRDYSIKNNKWTELSDWYSFGIIAFQLYTGLHPYRGKHPDFKINQWQERMEKGASVFDNDVRLPASFLGWDVIPKPHYNWFMRIFKNNERAVPPMSDMTAVIGTIQTVSISSVGQFKVKPMNTFKENIRSIFFSNGFRYTITRKSIYKEDKEWYRIPKTVKQVGVVDLKYNDPIIIWKEGDEVFGNTGSGDKCMRRSASEAMIYNGSLYTLRNGNLEENYFEKFQKVFFSSKVIASIHPSAKMFKGVIIEDILGHKWMAIPYSHGHCAHIEIPELYNFRVISAKYESNLCVVMAEKNSKYHRFIFEFNDIHTSYKSHVSEDVDFHEVNFTVRSGICINSVSDDSVEVFKTIEKMYSYKNPPFTPDMRLYSDGTTVYFSNNKKVYEVKMS